MEKALANELVRRIGSGDEKAFDELYKSMSGILYHFLKPMLWKKEAIEDAVHKTFAVVICKARSADVRSENCFAWIFGIARNVARSLPKADLCETPVDYTETDFPSKGAEEDFLEKLAVREALRRLPVESQQMIRLKFAEDLTYREMAGIFRTSETTVKRKMERILLKLRKRLED